MSDIFLIQKSTLTNAANAIRDHIGGGEITPGEFPEKIDEVYDQGKEDAKPNLQDKTLTVNGEHTADAGYDGFGKVTVNVADIPCTHTFGPKTVDPTTTKQTYKASDDRYSGYNTFTVNAIPTVERATTNIEVTADDKNDTLTILASNNQKTGWVEGSKEEASTTVTLTANGKTVTATADGKTVQKDVATIDRANTTLTSSVADGKLKFTAENNQETGWVEGSNETDEAIITLTAEGATVTASDGTNSISTTIENGTCTISGGDLSVGDAITPTVTLSNGDETNMVNITAGNIDNIADDYPYFFKVSGTSSAESSSVSRADIIYDHTAGYHPEGSGTAIKGQELDVTVNAGSGETYVGLKSAVLEASGEASATIDAKPGTISIAADDEGGSNLYNRNRIDIKGTYYKPTTDTDSDIIPNYYIAVNATAAANSTVADITGTAVATVSTDGYAEAGKLTGEGEITGTATVNISNKASGTYYIPIESGSCTVSGGGVSGSGNVFAAGNGQEAADGTGLKLKWLPSQPTSGDYIKVEGSGKVNRDTIKSSQTAGYIPSGDSHIGAAEESFEIATKYYVIAQENIVYLWGDYTFNETLTSGNFSQSFPFSRTNQYKEPLNCSTMSLSNAASTIRLMCDSTTVYDERYGGWQTSNGDSSNLRKIKIPNPVRLDITNTTSDAYKFYNWFIANTTSNSNWDPSSGVVLKS